MKKIAREDLSALFARLADMGELYLPVRNGESTNFAAYSPDAVVDLDTLKTVKSAKDVFFPQCETLYTCHRDGKKLSLTPEALTTRPFVLFGARACDVRGFAVLDKVFLSEPVDTFYAARRAHGTIISLMCTEPEESCFCGTFGIDHTAPGGDLEALLTSDTFYLNPITEKGIALMEAVDDLFADADDDALHPAKAAAKALMEKMPYHDLSVEGWGGDALSEKFDSPIWETLYKPCLACGTCTFVCPTCQCYDIKDYTGGKSVERYRCWDSCMYSDFTMMAHGNNRKSQLERFRQRFMHKLVYFPANYDGMFSCTGCGRCVEKCPASLNIVKVIKSFGGAKNA